MATALKGRHWNPAGAIHPVLGLLRHNENLDWYEGTLPHEGGALSIILCLEHPKDHKFDEQALFSCAGEQLEAPPLLLAKIKYFAALELFGAEHESVNVERFKPNWVMFNYDGSFTIGFEEAGSPSAGFVVEIGKDGTPETAELVPTLAGFK